MTVTIYDEIKSHEEDCLVDEGVRYIDVLSALLNKKDVYAVLGSDADSIDREKVFQTLSEIMGCEYDTIYSLWLEDAPF